MGGGGGGGGYTFKLERDYLASSIPRQPPVHKLSLNLNFRGMALLSKKEDKYSNFSDFIVAGLTDLSFTSPIQEGILFRIWSVSKLWGEDK